MVNIRSIPKEQYSSLGFKTKSQAIDYIRQNNIKSRKNENEAQFLNALRDVIEEIPIPNLEKFTKRTISPVEYKKLGFKNKTQALEFLTKNKINTIKDEPKQSFLERVSKALSKSNKVEEPIIIEKQAVTEEEIIKKNVQVIVVEELIAKPGYFGGVLKKFLGETIKLVYIVDNKVKRESTYDLPKNIKKFDDEYERKYKWEWGLYDGDGVFKDNNYQGKLYIFRPKIGKIKINTDVIKQYFLDGISHCVFTPIKEWAEDKQKLSKSRRTKGRYSDIMQKCEDYKNKYSNGLPEDKIKEICDDLQVNINISTPLNLSTKYTKSYKKPLTSFNFTNTRINHIELNELNINSLATKVTKDKLMEIKEKLDNSKEYYTWKNDKNGIISINTINKSYIIEDKNNFNVIRKKFEEEHNLKKYKLCDIKNPDLSKFIKFGTHYCSCVDFIEDVPSLNPYDYEHIDMEKAYTQSRKSKYYKGFMGKVTDFRKCNKIEGVGIYLINNISLKNANPKFKAYEKVMQMVKNNNAYPSPLLELLSDMGVKYNITYGCWGVKTFDLNFDDYMYEKIEEVAHYARWVGAIDTHYLSDDYYIKADKQYHKAIKEELKSIRTLRNKNIVEYYKGDNTMLIRKPKTSNNHLGHITAMILGYMATNMISQLMEMEPNKIVRICTDGIYYNKHDIKLVSPFRVKRDKLTFGNYPATKFLSGTYFNNSPPKCVPSNSEIRNNYTNQLSIGGGGTGKSFFELNDKGLVNVFYSAPSWKLCRSKYHEFNGNIHCKPWHYLLKSEKDNKYKEEEKISKIYNKYNVLVIDEVSMMSEETKQSIINTYPDMKIIMVGDIGYQLENFIKGSAPINKSNFDYVKEYVLDHRCKESELLKMKQLIREYIDSGYDNKYINNSILDIYKDRIINLDELKKGYVIKDMILCGTNKMVANYNELFKDLKKYYVTKKNKNHSKGDILYEEPINTNYEIKHSYTVHSIQGETAENNLYIDINSMWNNKMLYTAVSRARNINQIYFIL